MTKLATISLADAKALADEWEAQWQDHCRATHFKGGSPSEVIRMWESWKNERGQKLSQFEFIALVERWLELFNAHPPFEDDAIPDVAAEEPTDPEPEDDTMLQIKEVARLTGISSSTIKRMAKVGRFPKPMHLSSRRIGWPAREVKDWLNRIDGQRRSTRH